MAENQSEIVHLCPPGDSGLMPCCDRTPFEVPRTDRMTLDRSLVTCHALSTPPATEPCGACEDGCVHGTVEPCPRCRGRLVVPPGEQGAQ